MHCFTSSEVSRHQFGNSWWGSFTDARCTYTHILIISLSVGLSLGSSSRLGVALTRIPIKRQLASVLLREAFQLVRTYVTVHPPVCNAYTAIDYQCHRLSVEDATISGTAIDWIRFALLHAYMTELIHHTLSTNLLANCCVDYQLSSFSSMVWVAIVHGVLN